MVLTSIPGGCRAEPWRGWTLWSDVELENSLRWACLWNIQCYAVIMKKRFRLRSMKSNPHFSGGECRTFVRVMRSMVQWRWWRTRRAHCRGLLNTVCIYDESWGINNGDSSWIPFQIKGSEQAMPEPGGRQLAQELRGSFMEGASISKGFDNMPARKKDAHGKDPMFGHLHRYSKLSIQEPLPRAPFSNGFILRRFRLAN
jgi:hypothetical protein